MKSPWLTVCVVAAVAFLWMSEAQPDEPGKAAPPFADSMRGKAPGEVRDDNGLKMKLVWCSPGFVTMEQVEQVQKPAANAEQADGDDPEDKSSPEGLTATKVTPVKVLLSRGYWLGRYEVTQSEWKEVMKTEPWNGQAMIREGHDYPATCVNWNDAMEFCGKLTEHERKAGRLPADWHAASLVARPPT
jgi:formylglycine-generating enzyme required for sulfatase activity